MSYPVTSEPVKGGRHKGLLIFGIVLLLGGLGAGAALYVTSESQYEEAVKNLQRAPVGCDTEFSFTGTGTFIFYTETKGVIGDVRGDCENTDTDYDHGDGRVRVTLTFTDSDGNEVDLDRSSGITYDAGGYVGTSVKSVVIEEPGDFVLSVESDDSDFVISVGRDPKADADSLKTTALIVAGAGLVLGLLFIVLGMRRKPAPPASSDFGSPFSPAPFGAAPPGAIQQPFTAGGPPPASSPYPPAPQAPPTSPYPQAPPAPGGNWGSPTA